MTASKSAQSKSLRGWLPNGLTGRDESIQSWQASIEHIAPFKDKLSLAAQLARACLRLFRDLRSSQQARSFMSEHQRKKFRRQCQLFEVWVDAHGIAAGEVDFILKRAPHIAQGIMLPLRALGDLLANKLIQIIISDQFVRKNMLEESDVGQLLSEASDVLEFSDSDSDGYSTEGEKGERLVSTILSDIDAACRSLQDMNVALETPAMASDDIGIGCDAEPIRSSNVGLSADSHFAAIITERFTLVQHETSQLLGQANLHRYLRLVSERKINAERGEEVAVKEAESHYRDSALGSSLAKSSMPAVSSYAPTVFSLYSRRADGKGAALPTLSAEARNGEPFDCDACGKRLTIVNTREWKRHLYKDLKPYVCFKHECPLGREAFAFDTRERWVQHMRSEHDIERTRLCPLCGESVSTGMSVHLGRHLEEISIAALPKTCASEYDSDTESNDSRHKLRSTASTLPEESAAHAAHAALPERSFDTDDDMRLALKALIGDLPPYDGESQTAEDFQHMREAHDKLLPYVERHLLVDVASLRASRAWNDATTEPQEWSGIEGQPRAPAHDDAPLDDQISQALLGARDKFKSLMQAELKALEDSKETSRSRWYEKCGQCLQFRDDVSYCKTCKSTYYESCWPKGDGHGAISTGHSHKRTRVSSTNIGIHSTSHVEWPSESEEELVIRCRCASETDDGSLVLCEHCNTWQHVACYYANDADVPDVHECLGCNPDRKLQTEVIARGDQPNVDQSSDEPVNGAAQRVESKIDRKKRRRAAEVDRIDRWEREGLGGFKASIAKAKEAVRALDRDILELSDEQNQLLSNSEAAKEDGGTAAITAHEEQSGGQSRTAREREDDYSDREIDAEALARLTTRPPQHPRWDAHSEREIQDRVSHRTEQQASSEPRLPEPRSSRRGRRRIMKKRTAKDEEGYLITKQEAVWESFSEEESAASDSDPEGWTEAYAADVLAREHFEDQETEEDRFAREHQGELDVEADRAVEAYRDALMEEEYERIEEAYREAYGDRQTATDSQAGSVYESDSDSTDSREAVDDTNRISPSEDDNDKDNERRSWTIQPKRRARYEEHGDKSRQVMRNYFTKEHAQQPEGNDNHAQLSVEQVVAGPPKLHPRSRNDVQITQLKAPPESQSGKEDAYAFPSAALYDGLSSQDQNSSGSQVDATRRDALTRAEQNLISVLTSTDATQHDERGQHSMSSDQSLQSNYRSNLMLLEEQNRKRLFKARQQRCPYTGCDEVFQKNSDWGKHMMDVHDNPHGPGTLAPRKITNPAPATWGRPSPEPPTAWLDEQANPSINDEMNVRSLPPRTPFPQLNKMPQSPPGAPLPPKPRVPTRSTSPALVAPVVRSSLDPHPTALELHNKPSSFFRRGLASEGIFNDSSYPGESREQESYTIHVPWSDANWHSAPARLPTSLAPPDTYVNIDQLGASLRQKAREDESRASSSDANAEQPEENNSRLDAGDSKTTTHECPYCRLTFTRRHNYQTHLLTHSQEQPFECQKCHARFRRLHDLKRHHKEVHEEKRQFQCTWCGKYFARLDNLAKHSKNCSRRAKSSNKPDLTPANVQKLIDGKSIRHWPEQDQEEFKVYISDFTEIKSPTMLQNIDTRSKNSDNNGPDGNSTEVDTPGKGSSSKQQEPKPIALPTASEPKPQPMHASLLPPAPHSPQDILLKALDKGAMSNTYVAHDYESLVTYPPDFNYELDFAASGAPHDQLYPTNSRQALQGYQYDRTPAYQIEQVVGLGPEKKRGRPTKAELQARVEANAAAAPGGSIPQNPPQTPQNLVWLTPATDLSGFQTNISRHVMRDYPRKERGLRCRVEGCDSTIIFKRKADLDRHEATAHDRQPS